MESGKQPEMIPLELEAASSASPVFGGTGSHQMASLDLREGVVSLLKVVAIICMSVMLDLGPTEPSSSVN